MHLPWYEGFYLYTYNYSLIQSCLIIEVHVLLKIMLNISLHLWLYYLVLSILCMSWDFITMTCSDSYVLFVSYAVCLDVFHLKIMMPTGCLHNWNFNDKAVVTGHPIASDQKWHQCGGDLCRKIPNPAEPRWKFRGADGQNTETK